MDERKTLFIQFLNDKRTYNLNVSYWRKKLQKALDEKINSKDQFIQNRNNKGQKFYDGNPIFSYYSKPKNKALRIIQEDPIEISSYSEIKLIDVWLDKIRIAKNQNEDFEVQELVISIFLTSSSVESCMRIVRAWYLNDLNQDNIDNFLNEQT